MITVNNFFAHWIKEIESEQHGDDLQILPTGNSADIYRYSDAMLKHMPKDVQKTFETLFSIAKKMLQ